MYKEAIKVIKNVTCVKKTCHMRTGPQILPSMTMGNFIGVKYRVHLHYLFTFSIYALLH